MRKRWRRGRRRRGKRRKRFTTTMQSSVAMKRSFTRGELNRFFSEDVKEKISRLRRSTKMRRKRKWRGWWRRRRNRS